MWKRKERQNQVNINGKKRNEKTKKTLLVSKTEIFSEKISDYKNSL